MSLSGAKNVHRSGIVSVLATILLARPALAGEDLGQDINTSLNYGRYTGLGTRDIRIVVMLIINVILGFLTTVAIVLVLWGGYKWMVAGGNEDEVRDAKKIIISGVIGMAVIFSSYAIALFVVRSLTNVST